MFRDFCCELWVYVWVEPLSMNAMVEIFSELSSGFMSCTVAHKRGTEFGRDGVVLSTRS